MPPRYRRRRCASALIFVVRHSVTVSIERTSVEIYLYAFRCTRAFVIFVGHSVIVAVGSFFWCFRFYRCRRLFFHFTERKGNSCSIGQRMSAVIESDEITCFKSECNCFGNKDFKTYSYVTYAAVFESG